MHEIYNVQFWVILINYSVWTCRCLHGFHIEKLILLFWLESMDNWILFDDEKINH